MTRTLGSLYEAPLSAQQSGRALFKTENHTKTKQKTYSGTNPTPAPVPKQPKYLLRRLHVPKKGQQG